MANKFQVKLGGAFKNYDQDEDKILKRAYLSGAKSAKYSLRGQKYEVNFTHMKQRNSQSGKEREIRAPHKWKAPEAKIVKEGPTMCIKIPEGAPGKIIQVPLGTSGKFIAVNVPKTAKAGQSMLVPIPKTSVSSEIKYVEPSAAAAAEADKKPAAEKAKDKKKWSTGAKVAAGTAGVAVLGGVAVAGAVVGEKIAEDGLDATVDDIGDTLGDGITILGDGVDAAGASLEDAGVTDALEDAGGAIADVAEDAGDWLADAGEDVADFVMDLF